MGLHPPCDLPLTSPAWQYHPSGELSFVELVVLMDVEIAPVLALGLAEAALRGRTHDCTHQARDVSFCLANSEPYAPAALGTFTSH
jgi:hypothetical protein